MMQELRRITSSVLAAERLAKIILTVSGRSNAQQAFIHVPAGSPAVVDGVRPRDLDLPGTASIRMEEHCRP